MTTTRPNAFNKELNLSAKHIHDMPTAYSPLEMRYCLNLTQGAMARSLGISLRKWQGIEKNPSKLDAATKYALRHLIATMHPKAGHNINKTIQNNMSQMRKRLNKIDQQKEGSPSLL